MKNQVENRNEISQHATSPENGSNKKWKYVEKLSYTAPLFGVAFFIIYILGFVIVNVHLSTFGYVTYELLRGRYLGAGLSYTLSIIFILIWAPAIKEVIEQGKKFKRRAAKVAMIIVGLLTVFALANFSLYWLLFLTNSWAGGSTKLFDIKLSDFLLFGGSTLSATFAVIGLISDKKESRTERSNSIAWMVPVVLLTVLIYAKHLYPSIPTVIGGGQSIEAESFLISRPDHKNRINYTTLYNVHIIFEDENSFLLRVPKDTLQQVILLKRSDMHQIIYKTIKPKTTRAKEKTPKTELRKENAGEN